jgi:hypothetical protein
MPDDDDIAQLRKGVGAWNAWRDENPNVVHPDRGCTTLSSCSTAIECDATDRKLPQPDRSHKPWSEANGSAQCGKSARCVRRGGGWKRGTVERPAGAPVLDPTCEGCGWQHPHLLGVARGDPSH